MTMTPFTLKKHLNSWTRIQTIYKKFFCSKRGKRRPRLTFKTQYQRYWMYKKVDDSGVEFGVELRRLTRT